MAWKPEVHKYKSWSDRLPKLPIYSFKGLKNEEMFYYGKYRDHIGILFAGTSNAEAETLSSLEGGKHHDLWRLAKGDFEAKRLLWFIMSKRKANLDSVRRFILPGFEHDGNTMKDAHPLPALVRKHVSYARKAHEILKNRPEVARYILRWTLQKGKAYLGESELCAPIDWSEDLADDHLAILERPNAKGAIMGAERYIFLDIMARCIVSAEGEQCFWPVARQLAATTKERRRGINEDWDSTVTTVKMDQQKIKDLIDSAKVNLDKLVPEKTISPPVMGDSKQIEPKNLSHGKS